MDNNPYVELDTKNGANVIIRNDAILSKDSQGKLEIHLEKEEAEQNNQNNDLTIPLYGTEKHTPNKLIPSKDSSNNNDKTKLDSQLINLGMEKNGMIGKKRSRNEVSLNNEDVIKQDNSFIG